MSPIQGVLDSFMRPFPVSDLEQIFYSWTYPPTPIRHVDSAHPRQMHIVVRKRAFLQEKVVQEIRVAATLCRRQMPRVGDVVARVPLHPREISHRPTP